MADFQALGQQFCTFYYNTFDSDRSQLANLYRAQSMLTFENAQVQGATSIAEKLVSLPFQKVRHNVTTLDAQPSSPSDGGVLVMVTGELLIDEETNPQRYSQVFHLMPEGGSFYVFNDIFRLNVG
ncbi:nuclear transport factor 2 [Protomyces lactucae-debilis]|uniref:Nuclear transport factor 2 n=1 Tax=Protomyces lactucae-debilis TaxID=2754530 RepID=A0A1Y2FVA9_PROLT|nr:nuclear transport factor 2 [Protomyces lactucae-debilis]ORY87940.1 nuclear transport factor 2 [Protomyces lactucae-debilis]